MDRLQTIKPRLLLPLPPLHPLPAPQVQRGGKSARMLLLPKTGLRTRWGGQVRTPCPVWGPLAGEDTEERSSATGRQSAGCTGSLPVPAGPTHRSRSCCCRPAAPWGSGHAHRLTGCRRPGFPAPEQVAENCPSVAGVRGTAGVGPGVGRMTRRRGGGSPGRSHPASWATPRAGGSVLELRAEGRMPSWGVKAARRTARDHHRTPQGARGRAPGAAPPRDARRHPVPSP